MKLFLFGSCRINGFHDYLCNYFSENKLNVSYYSYLYGIEHIIQQVLYLKGEITIPSNLKYYIEAADIMINNKFIDKLQYSEEELSKMTDKCRNEFKDSDCFIIEISTLKFRILENYITNITMAENKKLPIFTSDYEKLMDNLNILVDILPKKKIIFICHFRPNIYKDNEKLVVKNREIIYNALENFCSKTNNCYLLDPSIIIQKNNNYLSDNYHYTNEGINKLWNYILKYYLNII